MTPRGNVFLSIHAPLCTLCPLWFNQPFFQTLLGGSYFFNKLPTLRKGAVAFQECE